MKNLMLLCLWATFVTMSFVHAEQAPTPDVDSDIEATPVEMGNGNVKENKTANVNADAPSALDPCHLFGVSLELRFNHHPIPDAY